MLIVISQEENSTNEMMVLQQLFELGLTTFHLRKPFQTIEETRHYLNKIPSKYHSNIVLHQYHELVDEYNVKGIHLKENDRVKRAFELEDDILFFKKKYNKTVSSSFHALKGIVNSPILFDYVFLSPVFHSISKKNYSGKQFDVHSIHQKTIALGGISFTTIPKAIKLGYDGVAVMGSIWKNKNPIVEFKKIQSCLYPAPSH
ncbi:thiamine phosphate synthase [Flavobacteriaceae bacterium UJ101]|nr:thiamine phosphate synthase [Flavobacteriaceae bacterium UJ101]